MLQKTEPKNSRITIGEFKNICYYEFDKNFSHTPEKHDFWELVYVDSGEVIAITDGHGRELTQGQIIFHKPGEVHSHISNKVTPNNMLVISFTSESSAMSFFDKKVFTLNKNSKTLLTLFLNEAKKALTLMPNEYTDCGTLDFKNAPFGSVELLECYLTELLIMLYRSDDNLVNKLVQSEDTRAIAKSSTIDSIIEYMKENAAEPITLKDICNEFFICKTELCNLFSTNLGTSPIKYFNSIKINEAKKLLRNDTLSVNAIADRLGYLSIHSFSHSFKRQVGFSPLEYRRSIMDQNIK